YANQPNEHFLDLDLFQKFLELIKPLQSNMGPILFQFEYLNKKKMPSLKQFLEQLQKFFSGAPKKYDYALEIRNPNYLKEEYFEFLQEHQLSTVLIEGYYMPPMSEVASQYDISTGKSTVIRLMGPDRAEIETLAQNKWDKIVVPKDESIESVVGIIKEQVQRSRRVFVNINNHYEGCAVLTAEKIGGRMGIGNKTARVADLNINTLKNHSEK
ncbi:MAG: DUF72 domain-containing protein, partial [Sedimentisphaerales bacterium]|nr:DUF72 domain-containing protein [Sedimentisphaerales bacterium]